MGQMLLPIVMLVALGAMMYFGMRRQKRAAAETQKMQSAVVPGSRVMTTSGLHGEVTAVADDTIELEISPGVRTTWVRAAVREVVVPSSSAPLDDSTIENDGSSLYDSALYDPETGQVSLDKRRSGGTDVG